MPDNSLKIKNIVIVGFLVFLAIAVVYCVFWGPAKKYADSLYTAKTINVSAEGKIEISPDLANLSFSVISEGTSTKDIYTDNTDKMNATVEFIKSEGIEEKDIKTTQYSLYPKYEYDEETRKTFISGYTLTQTVSVKVRDLTKVAEILDGLPPLGINQISNVSFTVENQEQYLTEARNQAFEKAKTKALQMASVNGAILGKIISFSEYPSPIYYSKGAALGIGGEGSVSLPQIEPGTQEISIQVNITYALK